MQDRRGTPSVSKIAEWWCSAEGCAHIRRLAEEYGPEVGAKLGEIEIDTAHCWACGHAPRQGRATYRTKSLGLERCHIKPYALGGSNESSNLLLMCPQCHRENPDSLSTSLFWRWFARVEDRKGSLCRTIAEVIPDGLSPIEAEWFLAAFKERLSQEQPVAVNGSLPASFVRLLVEDVVESWQGGVKR